jgi:hypothetical protein
VGPDSKAVPLTLVNAEGQGREVNTINELRRSSSEGYFARTTLDMRFQGGYYDLARHVLMAAQLASPPAVSFLDSPFVSVGNLELLPARYTQVLLEFQDGQPTEPDIGSTTVAQLVEASKCSVESNEKTAIMLKGVMRSFAMEVMRADLNGDGVQDILVHQAFQVVGGTMSWSQSMILTRLSKDGLLEQVPISFH